MIDHVKLVGRIQPLKWDQKEHPIQFSLYTPDGEDILLVNTGPSKMNHYLNQEVEIEGSLIVEEDDENKKLKIEKIRKKKNHPPLHLIKNEESETLEILSHDLDTMNENEWESIEQEVS